MPSTPDATSAPTHLEQDEDTAESERKDANSLLGMGIGVGAFGAASALLLGAVCPLCVVVAPALVGAGVYKRVRCKRRTKNDED
jgi:hypothetical protein